MSMDGRLSTNVAAIDSLLDGGLAVGGLTAVTGRRGTGKTMAMLAVAAKTGVDCVLYAPCIDYAEVKARIASICVSLGIDVDTVTYDCTTGLWLSIQFPDHRVMVAGHSAEATANGRAMLDNMEALAASGSASLMMFDAPCKGMKSKDEKDFVVSLRRLAKRYDVPVIVSTMLRSKPAVDPVINDVKKSLREEASDVIWISEWPKIVRGDAKFKVGVLSDDDHDGEWESKTADLTIHGAVSMNKTPMIGYRRQR